MADEVDEYELEKLRAEIQQERQMKEMLDQSARELRITVEELEKRYESIENEGNEWKTRFETQEEMNQQLERQIIMLQDKIEEAKRNLKDADLVQLYQSKKIEENDKKKSKKEVMSGDRAKAYVEGREASPRTGADSPKSKSTGITINISVSPQAGKTPRDMKSFDDLSDANPSMVKSMEKEKAGLYNQLRDLEWRLDQESKAYHKANDERKSYVLEINTTKGNIDGNKARQRAAVGVQQREVDDFSRSPRLMGYTERFQLKLHGSPEKELQVSQRSVKSQPSNKTERSDKTDRRVKSQAAPASSNRQSPASRISTNGLGSHKPNGLSSRIANNPLEVRRSNHVHPSNIPEDQRIIDPKRGPIRKTAAVKNLPSLDNT